jgi:hypothetical protein
MKCDFIHNMTHEDYELLQKWRSACVAYPLVVKTGTSLSSAGQYGASGFGYAIACIVKIVYT